MKNEAVKIDVWQQGGELIDSRPQIISRNEIPGLKSMVVEGKETSLGIVKHFKSIPYLQSRLPKNLSIAWTHLDPGEQLDTHFHPCPSMVIVANGEGASLGDTETEIHSGDVLHIPAWNLHGFVGRGQNGFWALSVQFQETAIFEKEEQPFTTYKEVIDIPSIENRQIQVVSRTSLPLIESVDFESKTFNLGEVRNFRENSLLGEILPKYFSSAWVKLLPKRELKTHVHETDSMIIVTEGEGLLQGDSEGKIVEGDIVYVPAGGKHGFIGTGKSGFSALSIQFEHKSLYERGHKPAVEFVKKETALSDLLRVNHQWRQKFRESSIFNLLEEKTLFAQENLQTFFSGLQVISDYFQKIMFSRVATCEDPAFRQIYYQHFLEELGHDVDLKKERDNKDRLWDPVLEGIGSWFVHKSQSIDNADKIAMVQLALEGGAHIFYETFAPLIERLHQGHHFNKHVEADEGHENMGQELLEGLPPIYYDRIMVLLEQTWKMLIAFLDRIYELTTMRTVPHGRTRVGTVIPFN